MLDKHMLLLELPCTGYQDALELQNRIVDRKIVRPAADVLILLEHPPTVTLGVRGKASDLLVSLEALERRGIALHHVDRGGEATYHGPGQLVGYPIIDLKTLRVSAREYVHRLEETLIRTLAVFQVAGSRRSGRPGVWTGPQEKIASIGVKIRRRVTCHGFSLNVDLPADPGELIICCGVPEARMVDLNRLTSAPVTIESVKAALARSFQEVFRVTLEPCSAEHALFT
jgi:lipoate-protein ligase B